MTDKYFTRHATSRGWNQEVIEKQVALVLGVGGVGNAVCVDLCRLGFGKIILVDKDVVEESNLNRQVLFSKDDIGKSKVQCAKERLLAHDSIRTEIEAHHLCALEGWATIVATAKRATCIFNSIDYGDYFDFAVASLARSLSIPLVDGGTDSVFGTLFSTTFSKARVEEACWGCMNDLSDKALCARLAPKSIHSLEDLSFIPADPRDGTTGSSVFTSSACSQFMVAMMVEYIMPRNDASSHDHSPECSPIPDRVIYRLSSFDGERFWSSKSSDCFICTDAIM